MELCRKMFSSNFSPPLLSSDYSKSLFCHLIAKLFSQTFVSNLNLKDSIVIILALIQFSLSLIQKLLKILAPDEIPSEIFNQEVLSLHPNLINCLAYAYHLRHLLPELCVHSSYIKIWDLFEPSKYCLIVQRLFFYSLLL